MLEHRLWEQRVGCSNHPAPTNKINELWGICSQLFRLLEDLGAYWEQAERSAFFCDVALPHWLHCVASLPDPPFENWPVSSIRYTCLPQGQPPHLCRRCVLRSVRRRWCRQSTKALLAAAVSAGASCSHQCSLQLTGGDRLVMIAAMSGTRFSSMVMPGRYGVQAAWQRGHGRLPRRPLSSIRRRAVRPHSAGRTHRSSRG